jgi:hypothetical protein
MIGLIWARALDYEIGITDRDIPKLPVLPLRYAKVALIVKSFIVLLECAACIAVICSVIRHWDKI